MNNFEVAIIERLISGVITDINTFVVELGDIEKCADPNEGAYIKNPHTGKGGFRLNKTGIAYIPKRDDTTSIKLAQFRNLVVQLEKNGYIALKLKHGNDLNRLGTIRMCRTDLPMHIDFTFYEDNWDLLFKKILPLPGLENLIHTNSEIPKNKIGFKL